ncbi:MAG: hypothetical protein ACOX87_09990 [Chloroflexota bacterium]|jgi:uncharacterized protein YjeT (DUF2065 family)
MARTIGYIFGSLLMLEGLIGLAQPRLGFELYDRGLHRYYPKPLQRIVESYRNLSDPAIQYTAFWFAAIGGLILWLASLARD